MEKDYRLTIAVNLELIDEPYPIEYDDEPADRVEVEAAAITRLKEDPDLRRLLFQLHSLFEAEVIIDELREDLEHKLSSYGLSDENKVESVLKAISTGYGAQTLVEASGRGYLEELSEWTN